MTVEGHCTLARVAPQSSNDNRILVLHWPTDLDFSSCTQSMKSWQHKQVFIEREGVALILYNLQSSKSRRCTNQDSAASSNIIGVVTSQIVNCKVQQMSLLNFAPRDTWYKAVHIRLTCSLSSSGALTNAKSLDLVKLTMTASKRDCMASWTHRLRHSKGFTATTPSFADQQKSQQLQD